VAALEEYIAMGAEGVKLYTCHGNFYDRPLDDTSMLPLFAYCEEHGIPLCWHINMSRPAYTAEFRRVMARFPRLKVIVPHFGVTFYRPGSPTWTEFWKLLDEYPGIYTDCCWGTRGILTHGLEVVSANVPQFREKFEQYQDKIMWGTDMVVTGNRDKTQEWIELVLRGGREMLEKKVYFFEWAKDGHKNAYRGSRNPDGRLNGLNLPDAILKKVYENNYPAFMKLRLE
jgi:predicted TIM-barrel fold metal-dependent hydrolase